MSNYYVFKLNLAPNIISSYTQNRLNGWDQLKFQVIKSDLERVFGKPTEFKETKVLLFSSGIEDIKKKLLNSEEYRTFIKCYKMLEDEYFKVVNDYTKRSGIFWSDQYLNIVKPAAINSLNKLLEAFPFLKTALEDISNDDVVGNLKGYATYGQGRRNMLDSRKVLKYIEEKNSIYSKIEFYYEPRTEHIYISADEESQNEAVNMAESIESSINATKDLNMGNVSINLIQEKVQIKKDYANITVHLVYPNGEEQVNERDIASRRRLNAEILKKNYIAPKGEKINVNELNKQLYEDARLGYLKGVYSKGKDILVKVPKIIEKFFY